MDYATLSKIRGEIVNGEIAQRLRLSQFPNHPAKIMMGNFLELRNDIVTWQQNLDLSHIQRKSYLHSDFLDLLSRRIYNFLSSVISVREQINKHYHRHFDNNPKKLAGFSQQLEEYDQSREGQIARGLRTMVVHFWNVPIKSSINEFKGEKSISIPTKELLDWPRWKNYPAAYDYFKANESIQLNRLIVEILNRINEFGGWYSNALQDYHKQDWADYNALVESIREFEEREFISRVSCNLQLKDRAFLNAFTEEEFRILDTVPQSDTEGQANMAIPLIRRRGIKNEHFEEQIRAAFMQ